MRGLFCIQGCVAGLIAALAATAEAEASSRWQGPGWYIVTANNAGATIRDGRFPDGATCYRELSHDNSLSKHSEFQADTCVNLTQDVETPSAGGPNPSGRPSRQTTPTVLAAPPFLKTPRDALPRFASLKTEGVQVRGGPSELDDVRWIYLRKGWPVEIIGESGTWRQIQDLDGETGWIPAELLTSERMAVLSGTEPHAIREKPARDATPVVWAKPDILIAITHCDFLWCEVKDATMSGFVERSALWGLLPGEWFP